MQTSQREIKNAVPDSIQSLTTGAAGISKEGTCRVADGCTKTKLWQKLTEKGDLQKNVNNMSQKDIASAMGIMSKVPELLTYLDTAVQQIVDKNPNGNAHGRFKAMEYALENKEMVDIIKLAMTLFQRKELGKFNGYFPGYSQNPVRNPGQQPITNPTVTTAQNAHDQIIAARRY